MDRRGGSRHALGRWDMIVPEVSDTTQCRITGHSLSAIGYGSLIKTYVQFILAKLRFHRLRPEFNGLFEYEEYITLKGIDDPNEGHVTSQIHGSSCIFTDTP